MKTTVRYPEIEVSGSPREMGKQIGEAAREQIRGFAEIAMERVNKTVSISRERALQLASDSFSHVEAYSADMVQEIHGMAESSGVSADELMLLQIRNQLQPEEDSGCTSFSTVNVETPSSCIVGQNWDNDPALDPFTVVLTRRPTDKPALMNITQAGLIAYIGVNDRGIGMCLNTLPAPSRPLGVPHYFLVRGIYESDSLDGTVAAVRQAERAIPANLMLATPQGPRRSGDHIGQHPRTRGYRQRYRYAHEPLRPPRSCSYQRGFSRADRFPSAEASCRPVVHGVGATNRRGAPEGSVTGSRKLPYVYLPS